MSTRSFRLVTACLIPGPIRAKQAGVVAACGAVVVCILAGCGSSAAPPPPQRIAGDGYRFDAPHGWQVSRSRLTVSASHDAQLVQVSTFPLVKRYRTALFDAVARELTTRMRQVAGQTGGKVEDAGDVTAAGIRSHVYRVRVDGHVDEYTFVLVGRREYQLLCRSSDAGASACRQLQTSFVLV